VVPRRVPFANAKHPGGRPRRPIPMEALFRLDHGEKTRTVARDMAIPRSTLARIYDEYRRGRGFVLRAPPTPAQNSIDGIAEPDAGGVKARV